MKSYITRTVTITLWMISFNYYAFSEWFDFQFKIFIFLILSALFISSIILIPKKSIYPKMINSLDIGNEFLVLFLNNLVLEIIISILFLSTQDIRIWQPLLTHIIIIVVFQNIVFWNGMVRVYIYSVQLGIKWRVIGILCGWIFPLNIWALCKIIKITENEIDYEKEKFLVNNSRSEKTICKTKYPILLVHGVFFRDSNLLNYWGRIPTHLEKNGASIFYGEHESASSIEDSGNEIAQRIKDIVRQTNCEKVNIIAHSKGGLDCRYAISSTDAKNYIASLTTVNTPHEGCLFADYLLDKISLKIQNTVASKYNFAAKKLGDKNPDFMKAVTSLTSKSCTEFNKNILDDKRIFYQSVGSKMNRAISGKFPLNLVYPLVKHFDGDNDGLVAVSSMKWGNDFTFVTTEKGRGISHADIIDLNRENIKNFDVREFYTDLVQGLKNRGF